MGWYTEGVKVNPIAGTLLADTGATPADTTGDVTVVVSSTAVGSAVFQHMAADGTTVIRSHIIPLAANGFVSPTLIINVVSGEHIRVVTGGAAIVGSVQASLMSNII